METGVFGWGDGPPGREWRQGDLRVGAAEGVGSEVADGTASGAD